MVACLNGRMLIFDGLDFQTRIIKLRPRQIENCIMCKNVKENLTIEQITDILNSFDYNFFCGVSNYNDKTLSINILDETQRITCLEYKELSKNSNNADSHLLVDVRPKCQFQICSLPNSLSKKS